MQFPLYVWTQDMAIDGLYWAVFCCLLLQSSMELCKEWHDTVLTISKFLSHWWHLMGTVLWMMPAHSLLAWLILVSGFPLYQAFSLGRFILLLLVSFCPVLLAWGLLSFLSKLKYQISDTVSWETSLLFHYYLYKSPVLAGWLFSFEARGVAYVTFITLSQVQRGFLL